MHRTGPPPRLARRAERAPETVGSAAASPGRRSACHAVVSRSRSEMTDPTGEQPPVQIQIELPREVEVGVPADFAQVWNTQTSFVIDFCAAKSPPQIAKAEDGTTTYVVPARVSARVRIPPEQVFELASVLTKQLDQWERATGKQPPYEGPPLPDA